MDTRLPRVGGWCAILTTVSFLIGIVLMASSGVDTLIPDTGPAAEDWVRQVDQAGTGFLAGGWFVVLGGLLGLVALVAFHDAFRELGRVMLLAQALAVAAMTLVTASHVLPLATASRFVPGYVASDGSAHTSLAVTLQLVAGVSQGLNLTGDTVLWGVVVPMYAVAALRSHVVARWIGWLGLVPGLFGGALGALGAFVSPLADISFVGFLAFFVWMTAMGVSLLRAPGRLHALAVPQGP